MSQPFNEFAEFMRALTEFVHRMQRDMPKPLKSHQQSISPGMLQLVYYSQSSVSLPLLGAFVFSSRSGRGDYLCGGGGTLLVHVCFLCNLYAHSGLQGSI